MVRLMLLSIISSAIALMEPSCPHPSKDYINLFYGTDFKNSSHVQVPDRSCSFCPTEPILPASLAYKGQQKRETWMLLKNEALETVVIYWVNTEGKELNHGVLIPGQRTRMRTFEGHLFRVYNVEHTVLYLEYLVGLVPLYNDFKAYSARPLATAEEMKLEDSTHIVEPDWNSVVPTSFVNRAGYNLDLYWNGWRGLELHAQIRPNQVHRTMTYDAHVWRAQIHDENVVLTEHAVAPLSIVECPERKVACGLKEHTEEPLKIDLNITDVSRQCEFFGTCDKFASILYSSYSQALSAML